MRASIHPASLTNDLQAVKLWSPTSRALYIAAVSIAQSPTAASVSDNNTLSGVRHDSQAAGGSGQRIGGGTVVDTASTRFGVRTIGVDGYKLMLNGQRIFLAGCEQSFFPNFRARESDWIAAVRVCVCVCV
jgi:hypothetical protein